METRQGIFPGSVVAASIAAEPVATTPVAPAPAISSDAFAPAVPAAAAAKPGGSGWGIREQRGAPPSVSSFAANMAQPTAPPGPGAPGYGTSPPAYTPGYQTPYPPAYQPGPGYGIRRPNRTRSLAGGLLIFLVVVGIRVFLSFGIHDAATATNKTYHLPTSIGSATQATDAQSKAQLDQFTSSIELPSLSNAHKEAAMYTDAAGRPAYVLVLGQDNAGTTTPRQGTSLADIGGDVSTAYTMTSNGVTLNCETYQTMQACGWYNSNGFGIIIDNLDTSPGAAAARMMPVLTAMVS